MTGSGMGIVFFCGHGAGFFSSQNPGYALRQGHGAGIVADKKEIVA